MSHELLLNPKLEHQVHHDLHSFFYVIFFMAVMFVGPNDRVRKDEFPSFLRQWLKPSDEETLGSVKNSLITAEDDLFDSKYLTHITPYFEPVKPLLRQLRKAIQQKSLTHDILIEQLNATIRSLRHEKPLEPTKEISTESPIDRLILEPDDLVDTREVELHTRLRGLGSITGPGMTVKGVSTYEAPYNTPLPEDRAENASFGKLPSMLKGELLSGVKDDSFLGRGF